jgi:hypothetical protein
MQTAQGDMLESLRAIRLFLDENADRLPGIGATGAMQRLADAITQLEEHASEQAGSNITSQGATRQTHVLRTALVRDHMIHIARIARADLPHVPSLEALRMPKGKPTVERLAAAADGMAKAATPYAAVFVAAGMASDFVTQLRSAVDAMLESRNVRKQSHSRRGGATTGLKQKLAAGRDVVAILDAFVKTALRSDPVTLSSWKIVKHVRKTTGRAATIAPAPVPSPSSVHTAA